MKNSGLIFMGLGFELAAIFIAGAYLGTIVDEHLGWKNMGFLVITGSLFIAWIGHFIYLIKQFEKKRPK